MDAAAGGSQWKTSGRRCRKKVAMTVAMRRSQTARRSAWEEKWVGGVGGGGV